MIRADDKLLDPDMPAQQLRLHMGEMTAQEMRTARAAIRWANTRASRLPRQDDEIRKAALEEAADYLDRRADEMPSTLTAIGVAKILRGEAASVRALSQKGDEADG